MESHPNFDFFSSSDLNQVSRWQSHNFIVKWAELLSPQALLDSVNWVVFRVLEKMTFKWGLKTYHDHNVVASPRKFNQADDE